MKFVSNRVHTLVVTLFFVLLSPVVRAEKVHILDLDQDARQSRVDLMMSARGTFMSSTYILGKDPVTLQGLSLLRHRARNDGLRSHIIVDSLVNKLPRAMMKHLYDEGIEIREHHPLDVTRPNRILQRMHDKIILSNDCVILGGRNADRAYFGRARRNYLDRDAIVCGPEIARQVREYFQKFWESDHVSLPDFSDLSEREVNRAKRELDRAFQQIKNHTPWLTTPPRDWSLTGDEAEVQFIHSDIEGSRRDTSTTTIALANILAGAKKSVTIESPYLVPTQKMMGMLAAAKDRKLPVKILTNSAMSTDGLLPAAGYIYYKDAVIEEGVELWEYQGPESLHAKSMVVDGEIAGIGSFNLDPRSAYLNSEVGLIIRSKVVAANLEASIDEHLRRSVLMGNDGERRNFSDYPPNPIKAATLFCLSLLTPVIKPQL